MANNPNDPNPGLRAELQAAYDTLLPEYTGLIDFAKVSISAAAVDWVNQEIQHRGRRMNLVAAVIKALDDVIVARDALKADGYPDMPLTVVPAVIFDEIEQQVKELDIAAALFSPAPLPASIMSITLGAPVAKS